MDLKSLFHYFTEVASLWDANMMPSVFEQTHHHKQMHYFIHATSALAVCELTREVDRMAYHGKLQEPI